MAISASPLESDLLTEFRRLGLVTSGTHAWSWIAAEAVATGVVDELHATAVVVVPGHAGGTYKVTQLSESGMKAKIQAVMAARGIVFTGKHARAEVMPIAVAYGVTTEVLASAQVSIPYDGSGTFQIVGVSASVIEGLILAKLQAQGIVTSGKHAYSHVLAKAVGKCVASRINGDAVVSGGFEPGGTYPVL